MRRGRGCAVEHEGARAVVGTWRLLGLGQSVQSGTVLLAPHARAHVLSVHGAVDARGGRPAV